MFKIDIFNTKSMKREHKNFRTQEQADQYFDKKKARVELACEPREKYFSYRNDWGTLMFVQKMY